ncbi:hypothetical protein [Kitasatospora sp. NBC_01302]|uniref:hypothetical protein n=1 Tax=Kitasatospora sp. NBC_01302 TaxID=2903575 RepID=UPI002E10E876|nr:hypothetical protein OG294_14055 [Kitasatospora sp. NBC_01302]
MSRNPNIELAARTIARMMQEGADATAIANKLEPVLEDPRLGRPQEEITQLREQIAKLEENSAVLRALEAAGVDNWDGYSDALSSLD